MNRSVFGVILLLALLLAGTFVENEMNVIHRPIARMLEVCADSGLEEDWETAETLASGAVRQWSRRWQFSAALADHGPMEEIDCLFAQLEIYTRQRDSAEFAAVCQELARRIDAVADAHTLNWQNLL